ncbi:isoprenoid synthase domain-containing protein [Mycena capillaripes]|nr:isoprenoid synthase domain-containing protein [Mycena capillaripes]
MVKLGSHDYVQTLKGQTLKFPNCDFPFKDWPKGISPHYQELRMVQDLEVKKIIGDGKAYEMCAAADSAYLAATWFPKASWDRLRVVAQFCCFLYLCDDVIDTPEVSTHLIYDRDAFDTFGKELRKQINRYLEDEPRFGGAADAGLPVLTSFVPVGEAVAFRMTKGQRLLALDELLRYVEACGLQQVSELSGQAPTIEEYLPYRMRGSAVGCVASFLEYMICIDLGDTIRNDEHVKVVFEATVCIVAIMNDILSLKRELRYPFFNNAVAVLYHQHQDLQKAVDETYRIVHDSIEKLDEAARLALDRYPERYEDLGTWIDGCKNICTGSIAWSLHISRYSLGEVKALDGTTEITL